jgi:hypothetical protein
LYNTLGNTCTTNLVRHVNDITPGRIPPSPAILFPGYSDRLAFDLGLIDTDLPLEQLRERYRINDLAIEHADAPDFSRRIRGVEDQELALEEKSKAVHGHKRVHVHEE